MSHVLPIRTYGDPVLREPARPVAQLTPDIQALIDDMFATMRAAQGVGLAAQQVGRTESICVVELPEDYDSEDDYYAHAADWMAAKDQRNSAAVTTAISDEMRRKLASIGGAPAKAKPAKAAADDEE